MPKLSIIIPTFNEETQLPKLLAALKRQTFRDFEVIVADAKSKDRTPSIAMARGARVVEGGLPAVGRNAGARVAHGIIFLFLDADVTLPDVKFLERTVGEFERRKLDVATTLITPITKRALDRVLYKIYNVYTLAVQKVMPHIPGFCIFVRRRLHEAIRGFDERLDFAEDHDYARRAALRGRFGFLRSDRIKVSTRRFDRDGRFSIAMKYLVAELYLLTQGKVPPGAVTYGWGYGKKKKR